MLKTPEQIEARRARRKKKRAKNKIKPIIRDYRLYVLQLENEKYYVGVTAYKNVKVRYQQHLDGIGAKWTALHKPKSIIEVKELGMLKQSDAALLEDELTLYYMEKYGVASVRGGSMCAVDENTVYKYYDMTFLRVNKPKKTPPEKRIEQIDIMISNLQKEKAKLLRVSV
jgi:predicted GIY-YIG superfamily endonuclease